METRPGTQIQPLQRGHSCPECPSTCSTTPESGCARTCEVVPFYGFWIAFLPYAMMLNIFSWVYGLFILEKRLFKTDYF